MADLAREAEFEQVEGGGCEPVADEFSVAMLFGRRRRACVVEDEGDLEVELFGGVSDAEFADFAEDEREILRSSRRTTGWSQQGWRWQAQMHGNPHG